MYINTTILSFLPSLSHKIKAQPGLTGFKLSFANHNPAGLKVQVDADVAADLVVHADDDQASVLEV